MSLYDGWLLALAIRVSAWSSRFRVVERLACLPVARRWRTLVLDKGPALLLRDGNWSQIRRLIVVRT